MPRALVIPRPGGAPSVVDVPADPPALRLVAAEVLPLDLQIAAGRIPGLPFPLRAGQVAVVADGEGRCFSVQAGPSGYGLGAPVGTFADVVPVPPSAGVPLPAGLDPLAAAAGASSVLSARLALAAAEVSDGARVAVTGATGGVGRACVELAAARGLAVTAVARRPDAVRVPEGVRVVGLDGIGAAGPFDAVLDTTTGVALRELIATGAPHCRHVVVGYAGSGTVELSLPSLLLREHRLVGFNAYATPADVLRDEHEQALSDLADGTVTPYDYRISPLDDAAAAYEAVPGVRSLIVP